MITTQEKINNYAENTYPLRRVLKEDLPIIIFSILTLVGVTVMITNPDLFFGDPSKMISKVESICATYTLLAGVVGLMLATVVKICDVNRAIALNSPRCKLTRF